MIGANLMLLAIIIGEITYRLAVVRWNARKQYMLSVTERNVWLLIFGLATLEFPPRRVKFYTVSILAAIVLMILF